VDWEHVLLTRAPLRKIVTMLPDDFLADAAAIAPVLLKWFAQYQRDLPWRRTRDPYAIWVSEIMLQQTRVAAVLDHYARWMERFPTVAVLAAADEASVLALWSGLGYYRRARMLHRAAQVVVVEHDAALPRTAAALARLPGIGDYTSAAIASIAFGEAVAVVDGNVERVITRLAGLAPKDSAPQPETKTHHAEPALPLAGGAKLSRAKLDPINLTSINANPANLSPANLARVIRESATALLTTGHAGNSNQALMELGATICLPRAPLCLQCPAQPWCRTRGEHAAAPRAPLISRSISYALAERSGQVLLEQRPQNASLMAGMWELPQVLQQPDDAHILLRLRHAITVTNYAVTILRLPPEAAAPGPCRYWTLLGDLPTLPLTGLARKVLKRLDRWPTAPPSPRAL
jgi:A/G-specific adenine glycosylase